MIVQNINSKQKSRGFTIVELLVVIVVIGILAAITIVSYTGITAKANKVLAQSNASSAQAVIEVMAADNSGVYPVTAAAINAYNGITKMPAGVSVVTGQSGANGTTFTTPATAPISATNGKTAVTYACMATVITGPCLTTGGRITYWDFETSLQAVVYVGTASATSIFFNPAT